MALNNERIVCVFFKKNSPCILGWLFSNTNRTQTLKSSMKTKTISEQELLIFKLYIMREKNKERKDHERKKL